MPRCWLRRGLLIVLLIGVCSISAATAAWARSGVLEKIKRVDIYDAGKCYAVTDTSYDAVACTAPHNQEEFASFWLKHYSARTAYTSPVTQQACESLFRAYTGRAFKGQKRYGMQVSYTNFDQIPERKPRPFMCTITAKHASDGELPLMDSAKRNGAHRRTSRAIPPTLGLAPPWGPDAQGFGEVEPHEVFNGGDPSGAFHSITWHSWGGARATGSGIGLWIGPDQSVAEGAEEPITLVAYDLEMCGDSLAYRHLAVYFPEHGQTFDPATNGEAGYDLCAGP